MATVTLTELNRNASRIAKIAEGEDVIITERGVPRLRLTRMQPGSLLDDWVAAGLIVEPPSWPDQLPLPKARVDAAEAADILADWEATRARDW